jgi:tetratricopeptide (TPR) repeat protein
MGTYEEERLIREVSAMQLELRSANEQSWVNGQASERSYTAIRSDLDQMNDNLLGMEGSLQQIAYSLDFQLPLIVSHLARSAELLERIMNSVQKPAETQAGELRRHGLLAFKNGWLDEAITEFKKSIDAYGYDPSVHFALGCALAGEQNYPEAAESFAKAARYGFPDQHSLAASAAILSARLYDQMGSGEQAVGILTTCYQAVPSAADVAYELARRTGQRQHLSAALSLKPSLLVRARVDNLAELEHAAREVLDVSPAFAALQSEAAHAFDELATLLTHEGQPSMKPVVPLPAFPSASARLALFTGELPLIRQRLSAAINKTRAYAAELSETARSRSQSASYAQSALVKPVPPPEPQAAKKTGVLPAISGIVAFVMLILVITFQSSHLAETASGKSLLTGLIVWGGFLVSGFIFVTSIRPALQEARKNANARSGHRTSMDDYRKRLAAYKWESSKAAELQSAANEISRKAEAFTARANSVISAAEAVRRRLEWSVVEPVAMSVGAGGKGIGAH